MTRNSASWLVAIVTDVYGVAGNGRIRRRISSGSLHIACGQCRFINICYGAACGHNGRVIAINIGRDGLRITIHVGDEHVHILQIRLTHVLRAVAVCINKDMARYSGKQQRCRIIFTRLVGVAAAVRIGIDAIVRYILCGCAAGAVAVGKGRVVIRAQIAAGGNDHRQGDLRRGVQSQAVCAGQQVYIAAAVITGSVHREQIAAKARNSITGGPGKRGAEGICHLHAVQNHIPQVFHGHAVGNGVGAVTIAAHINQSFGNANDWVLAGGPVIIFHLTVRSWPAVREGRERWLF